jgi:hypothetical protein
LETIPQHSRGFWLYLSMNCFLRNYIVLFLIFCLLTVSEAFTQVDNIGNEGVRIFEPIYYIEFDPVTALDLVNRTPGFNLQSQSGGRGLSGVRSNILINGERPPPKGQSIWQQLSDTPYTNVTYIELIDTGAALDIDMQGYTQVVNVILDVDRTNFYELSTDYSKEGLGEINQRNERALQLDATASFSLGKHEFKLNGGKEDRSNKSPADFISINPGNPELRLSSPDESERDNQFLDLSSIFNLKNKSMLSMNAQFYRETNFSAPRASSAGHNAFSSVRRTSTGDVNRQEFSAEYRRPFGARSEMMLAVVDSRDINESGSSFLEEDSLLSSVRSRESGESAARLLLSNRITNKITLRSTLSTAFNFFEGTFQSFNNGSLLDLDGSDSRVEEDRHSLQIEGDWNWRDNWILRGAISGGAYTINTQELSSGAQSETKGRGSVAYRLKERTTITYESRYEVGQLSFNQFLASSSLSSDVLQAGAGSLLPERQWNHSISYDQRFGDRGVLKFSLSHQNVQNPVRSVPLSDTRVVSKNTSPEKINYFNVSFEYPFTRFGLDSLVLNTGVTITDSETIDPVTGIKREVPWAAPIQWSLGMRKNPGQGKWTWGFNVFNRTFNHNYSVRSFRERDRSYEWRMFADWEIISLFKLSARIEGPRTEKNVTSFFSSIRKAGIDPFFISGTNSKRDSSASFSVEWRRTRNLEVTASINTRPNFKNEQFLRAFGETATSFQTREVAQTPRFQIQFRFFTQ